MYAGFMTQVAGAAGKGGTFTKTEGSRKETQATNFMDLLNRSLDNQKNNAAKNQKVVKDTEPKNTQPKETQPKETQAAEQKQPADYEAGPVNTETSEQPESDAAVKDETSEPTPELQAMLAAILWPQADSKEVLPQEPVAELLTAAATEMSAPLTAVQSDGMYALPEQTGIQMPVAEAGAATSQQVMAAVPESVPEPDVTGELVTAVKQPKEDASITALNQPEDSVAGLNGRLKLLESQQAKTSAGQSDSGSQEEQMKDGTSEVNHMLEELKKQAETEGHPMFSRISETGVHASFKAVGENSQTELQTPVLEQLKTGLEQGMKQELKEFTLKLKPEGLGEIVVKLVSSGGKVGIHIGVTNPETEKLISSQMAGLKEMLEPLHAQVEEVYHNSQSGLGFAGFGQDMNRQQERHSAKAGYHPGRQNIGESDSFDMEAEKLIMESRLSKLYAYI